MNLVMMLVFPTDWSPRNTSLYFAKGETEVVTMACDGDEQEEEDVDEDEDDDEEKETKTSMICMCECVSISVRDGKQRWNLD